MLHCFKRIKKNTCRYRYQNLDDMIYSSWDIEQNILKLVNVGPFLPFYPLKKPKNQTFKKWKNLLEISLFFTCVPKSTIIWSAVPEIRSETQNFFDNLGHFTKPHLITHSLYQQYYCDRSLKKSHTCEEGGAHLRISFWHLLMNLKNNVEVGQ